MNEQPPPGYGQASNPAPATVGQPQVFKEFGTGGDGQQQMFHSPPAGIQSQPRSAFQAVSYMPVQPAMPPMTTALPPSLQPYSFLVLSLTIMIVCAILNVTSIAFGIPALILSIQSEDKKRNYEYERAKTFGAIAVILSVINITYTLFIASLAIGLSLGLALQDCYYDYCY